MGATLRRYFEAALSLIPRELDISPIGELVEWLGGAQRRLILACRSVFGETLSICKFGHQFHSHIGSHN